ncbi:MAG: hypothetical protein GX896_08465 [Clostridiales bacterium]|nr:hypothetical protein [Clostridiales bacterium]
MKKEKINYSSKNLKNNPDYELPVFSIKHIYRKTKKNIIIPFTIKNTISDTLDVHEVTK